MACRKTSFEHVIALIPSLDVSTTMCGKLNKQNSMFSCPYISPHGARVYACYALLEEIQKGGRTHGQERAHGEHVRACDARAAARACSSTHKKQTRVAGGTCACTGPQRMHMRISRVLDEIRVGMQAAMHKQSIINECRHARSARARCALSRQPAGVCDSGACAARARSDVQAARVRACCLRTDLLRG